MITAYRVIATKRFRPDRGIDQNFHFRRDFL
jgi:hypothetical protein